MMWTNHMPWGTTLPYLRVLETAQQGTCGEITGNRVRHKGRWRVELCRKIKSVLPFS